MKTVFEELTASEVWASYTHIFEWDIKDIQNPMKEFAMEMGLCEDEAIILHEGLAKGESFNTVKSRLCGETK